MGEVIDRLATNLANARQAEAEARAKRIEAEEAIIAQVELGESERKTLSTDNGLKITMQSGLNYKLAKGELPDWMPIKRIEKVELDKKAYEQIRESDPATFAKLSEYVTTSPKKTSVTLAVQ